MEVGVNMLPLLVLLAIVSALQWHDFGNGLLLRLASIAEIWLHLKASTLCSAELLSSVLPLRLGAAIVLLLLDFDNLSFCEHAIAYKAVHLTKP